MADRLLDRVVPVRADLALVEALDRARTLRAPEGVTLTRADVIRSLLWEGLRRIGAVVEAPPIRPDGTL